MQNGSNVTALVGGTVYVDPVQDPIRNGVVLIDDGKVTAVGDRSAIALSDHTASIDCSGLTITAGFWNCHVHFFERKWASAAAIPSAEATRQLQEMLTRYGFTSVFDLSSMWSNTRKLRDRIESGEVLGPRIRSTGEGLLPPNARPSDTVFNMMGAMIMPLPEIGNAEHASGAARKALESGVDGVKIFASAQSGAPLPESVFRAVATEAHRVGKPFFVHPNTGEDVLAAVRGGVDIVAHTTPYSGPWSDSILQAMKQHQVALTPTLWIWKYYARHDRVSARDQIVNTAVGQLRAWAESGGEVLFGTDLGAVDPDPTEEYLLMAEAGMSFRQVLASLTTIPAARFGESNRLGRIAPGFLADLTVLNGDPAVDIQNLASVRYTLRDGRLNP
jgi:imidazolonepropionase-like amidohydrolase